MAQARHAGLGSKLCHGGVLEDTARFRQGR
jgi:hypothetical protein